jgi:hypothetical protein
MVILGGWVFLMNEVPLYCTTLERCVPWLSRATHVPEPPTWIPRQTLQGYLTHKKTLTPLGPP